MRTTRTGYLMAMLAGVAVVGASTAGVSAATSHHNAVLAAEHAGPVPQSVPQSVPHSGSLPSPSRPSTSLGSPPSTSLSSPPSTPLPAAAATPSAASTRSSRATATNPTRRTTAASSRPAQPAPATALKYKDGQYSATGSYNSPGGIEKLGVKITLASDKVVKSELDLLGGAGLSHTFQSAFASGYASQVIGRNIDSISLGAVSGSSLTGLGFNDALKQIESQAKNP